MTKTRSSGEGPSDAGAAGGNGEAHAAPTLSEHWLSRGLKRMYDDALQEPVPDSLRDLLDELARRDREKAP